MADVSTLRADIKSWERTFKEKNGRDPTVDDIRKQSTIAEKYKLYKKLSKAAAVALANPASSSKAPNLPSTPPRQARQLESRSSMLLLNSRVVQPTVPLSSFNPFSPQKKDKGKQKELVVHAILPSNPFASPVKIDTHTLQKSPSPNTTPVSRPPNPLAPLLSPAVLPTTTAVSRARKRLRGEPVSPSPNKGKRQRIGPQTTLPFPKLKMGTHPSDIENEDDLEAESSFVDDSPVKAPLNGKSFQVLFEDTIILSGDLFGLRNTSKKSHPEIPQEHGFTEHSYPVNEGRKTKGLQGKTTELIFGKKGLTDIPESSASRFSKNKPTSQRELILTRTSTKRPLHEVEMDHAGEVPTEIPEEKPRLLSPSPPLADNPSLRTTSRYNKAKGKAIFKSAASRKKAKMSVEEDGAEEDETDGTEALSTKIKVVDGTRARPMRASTIGSDNSDFLGLDLEPLLGFTMPHASLPYQLASAPVKNQVEIDLPDKLRQVLALESLEFMSRDVQEEQVARSLIYGKRIGHYDPTRGGEIWGAGEDSTRFNGEEETKTDLEGEDDWEGEPVPWEVGEL